MLFQRPYISKSSGRACLRTPLATQAFGTWNTRRNQYIPGFLKTGLATILTHSTSSQFKTIKLIQRPIKSPLSDAGQ